MRDKTKSLCARNYVNAVSYSANSWLKFQKVSGLSVLYENVLHVKTIYNSLNYGKRYLQ